MNVMEFMIWVVLISNVAAWLLTLLSKWGVIEWVQVHGNEFFHKMFSCWYCLCWWTSWVFCLVGFMSTWDWQFLIMPFFTTTMAKKLL